MAEVTVSHFRNFDELAIVRFANHVTLVTGIVVYGGPEFATTEHVTLRSQTLGPGSMTSASSGTEVKVHLDDEMWPEELGFGHDAIMGQRARACEISHEMGHMLLGGVNKEEGALVNVFVHQDLVSGWHGIGYTE